MPEISIIAHFIFSSISTAGFAVFFNSPVHALVPAGVTGGLGWCVYILLNNFTENPIFANFVAAMVISLLSEILARRMKHPAILFVIPGIIPLVPGLGLYNTMLYLVQKDYNLAVAKFADTLFVSVAIALGVLVITSMAKTLLIVNSNKKMTNK